jgi:hypothetical protein
MTRYIEKGDLIKSNPLDGFWVCSVVLTSRGKTNDFAPMCHVAITNAVFEHDFSEEDIDWLNIRVIPVTTYLDVQPPCIGMYASKVGKDIEVIGKMDVNRLYSHTLAFEIGNGSDGGWPQCGAMTKSLGFEAVHQWRSINDRDTWLRDIQRAEKSHLEMLKRLENAI